MSKKTYLNILIYTIGGLFFAIGMCMCLISEWNLFNTGVVCTTIGAIILIVNGVKDFIQAGKKFHLPSMKTVGTVILGTIGVLLFGVGMCLTMLWSQYIVLGIILGVIGIVALITLIPVIKGFSNN